MWRFIGDCERLGECIGKVMDSLLGRAVEVVDAMTEKGTFPHGEINILLKKDGTSRTTEQ